MATTSEDLRLVLDAARQHYRNEQHWRSVNGPAYFESNLMRAENRKNLGETIDRLEKGHFETMPRLKECVNTLRHLNYAHGPESGLLYLGRTERDSILSVLNYLLTYQAK